MEEQNLTVNGLCATTGPKSCGGRSGYGGSPVKIWLAKQDCMDADTYGDYVSYECVRDGELISGGCVIFCAPKHYHFGSEAYSYGGRDVLTTGESKCLCQRRGNHQRSG